MTNSRHRGFANSKDDKLSSTEVTAESWKCLLQKLKYIHVWDTLIIRCLWNLRNKPSTSFLQIWHLTNQVAIYTDGSQTLEWRETGQLPTPKYGHRAAVTDNILYVTGGFDGDNSLASILSWNPSTETWQSEGEMALAKDHHAAVAAPSSILSSECSQMPLV